MRPMSNDKLSEGIKTAGEALTLIERIAGLFRGRSNAEKAAAKRRRADKLRRRAKSSLTVAGMARKLDRATELDREADLLAPR